MKKNMLFIFIGVLTILAACGNEEGETSNSAEADSENSNDSIVLDISTTTGPNSANTLGGEKFVEELERLTDGEISGDVYSNNTFGGEREVIEMMGTNSLDVAITSTGPMGTFLNEFNALDLPFLFENVNHAYAVMDSEIGDELSEKFLEQTNVRILGYMENGFRQPTSSKGPVNSVEDVNNLKIRTQENEVQLDTWEAYGANPSPVSWPEVYTSLQQGVIDGQANPVDVIYDMSFQDVQNSLALLDDVYSPMPLMISEAKFESFSEEHQEAIIEAAGTAVEYQREIKTEMNEEALIALEEAGVEITEPDRDSFEAQTDEVYEKWTPEFGEDFIERIREYDY